MTPIQKKLLNIQESGAFELLEVIHKNQEWKEFSVDDRLLFAKLLLLMGEKQLIDENEQVFQTFDLAKEVTEDFLIPSAEILLQQGTIFFKQRKNPQALRLAFDAVLLSLEKNPLNPEAWHLKAQILVELGLIKEDFRPFIDANLAFEQLSLLIDQGHSIHSLETIYWGWAFCLAFLARFSGEPSDFQKALQKYRKTLEYGCEASNFFYQYAHTLAEFAGLVGNQDYFKEALHYFELAIKKDPTDPKFWYDQGCCLQTIALFDFNLDLIQQAADSFEEAAQLRNDDGLTFFKWGQCETISGKVNRTIEQLQKGLKLFEKAAAIEVDFPPLLNAWADAELFLGALIDDYQLILSGQNKIAQSLKIDPSFSEGWYIYGSSYLELGRYFADESYYHEAIKKFESGLAIDSSKISFVYGIALAYHAIGTMTEEMASLNKALEYFEQVNQTNREAFPYFFNDWGMTLLKIGEITEDSRFVTQAIEKFSQLLESEEKGDDFPSSIDCLYNYGYALDLLGDLTEEPHYIEKAIEVLSQIIEKAPDFYQARFSLAIAFWHYAEEAFDVDSFHKAIEQFETLVRMDNEDGAVHLDFGTALVSLGLLIHDPHHEEHSKELFERAEHHLMEAASLGNTESYYQLVGLYSINENYPLAIHFLEKARFFDALPNLEDLLSDHWLEGLRQTVDFRTFVNSLSMNEPEDKNT